MPDTHLEKLSPPARPPMSEIGVAGLKISTGIVQEEYLPQLQGQLGLRVFRDMSESDATVGALLRAVDLLCRAVPWTVEAAGEGGAEAEDHAEFARSLLYDMSHAWEDFISEALTMLVYGWSFFEVVAKRRVSPTEADPSRRSRYADGRVGIRKLAPRAQTTLVRWEMDEEGGIAGLWQSRLGFLGGGAPVFIPIERALLFRTQTRNGNPEGRSILRNAYRSWHIARVIENSETIGIERELCGVPVVRIPSSVLTSPEAPDVQVRTAYERVAKDLKFNEQGGLVIPSDTFRGPNGEISSVPIVTVELLASAGARTIDTDRAIRRRQAEIARSVLADFLMLGTDGGGRGSFALSSDKSSMFLDACQTFLNGIAAVWNRHALPRVWRWNGFDPTLTPSMKPGEVKPKDLAALGTFLTALSNAGATLWPDPDLDRWVRAAAGMPEPKQEMLDLRERQHEAGIEAMEQGVAAGSGAAEDPDRRDDGEDPDAP